MQSDVWCNMKHADSTSLVWKKVRRAKWGSEKGFGGAKSGDYASLAFFGIGNTFVAAAPHIPCRNHFEY